MYLFILAIMPYVILSQEPLRETRTRFDERGVWECTQFRDQKGNPNGCTCSEVSREMLYPNTFGQSSIQSNSENTIQFFDDRSKYQEFSSPFAGTSTAHQIGGQLGVAAIQLGLAFNKAWNSIPAHAASIKERYASFPIEKGLSPEERELEWQRFEQRYQSSIQQLGKTLGEKAQKDLKEGNEYLAKHVSEINQQSKRILAQSEELRAHSKMLQESARAEDERVLLEKEIVEQGGYSETQLADLEKLLFEIAHNSNDVDDAVLKIDIMRRQGLDAKNSVAKAQLVRLLEGILNREGLIEPWLEPVPWLENYHFNTRPEDKEGARIREYLNRALGFLRNNRDNFDLKEQVDYMIHTLLQADALLGETVEIEPALSKEWGHRLLSRGVDFYKYLNPGPTLSQRAMVYFPKKANEVFGLDRSNDGTFAGWQILEVADKAIRIPEVLENETLRFHMSLALQQASADADNGDWKSAIRGVDRAWAILDYARGLVKGLYTVGEETVAGIAHLLTHPIDSAEAIADALVNYDRTYDAISDVIGSIWVEYQYYSPEQKGKLWGQIAGEVMSAIYGGSFIKLSTDLKAIAGLKHAAEFIELARSASPGRLKYVGQTSAVSNVFGPLRKGPLHEIPVPSGGTVADTFRSSTYVEVTVKEPVKLYRVWSEGRSEFSNYWSRTKPTGPLQAQLDAALDPAWKNLATHWTEITVPIGERFYEGVVSQISLYAKDGETVIGGLLGGGNQIFINKKVPKLWQTSRGEFKL